MVLDASMALAWLIERTDPTEAALSRRAFEEFLSNGALIPTLWFAEVANTLLVFERAKRFTAADSTNYLSGLELLDIKPDDVRFSLSQPRVIDLGRMHNLTAYDATYLELAIRKSAVLATFDRKLAQASRAAGIRVFGDPAHP